MALAMKLPGSRISRRRFLGGVSFFAAGTFGYARCFEAERLQTTRVAVPLGTSRRPLTLLHLSDLHASGVVSLDYIGSAIDSALQCRPDLICVTGDFITTTYGRPTEYARILRRLSDAAPAFAIVGNHDGGSWAAENDGYGDREWITGLLRDARLPLLFNTSHPLSIHDWDLNLVGLGDAWAHDCDPAAGFRDAVAGRTTILLSHNPDTKSEVAPYRWDLMLSGHTHGGQLDLPVIGTPFAPVHDKRFVSGLHGWHGRWIYITRGIGSIYGMRINCPPEISLLTLT